MSKFIHPSKQAVRDYLQYRWSDHRTLPDLQEIRRLLWENPKFERCKGQ